MTTSDHEFDKYLDEADHYLVVTKKLPPDCQHLIDQIPPHITLFIIRDSDGELVSITDSEKAAVGLCKENDKILHRLH